jgi:hypothetical protein
VSMGQKISWDKRLTRKHMYPCTSRSLTCDNTVVRKKSRDLGCLFLSFSPSLSSLFCLHSPSSPNMSPFPRRKLNLCHYQTTDSLECHYKNTLCYYAIFKHWITDKMPFKGLFDKVSTDWTILPLN